MLVVASNVVVDATVLVGTVVGAAVVVGALVVGAAVVDAAVVVGSLSLPKGQLTVQGLVDRTGLVPVTIAITGGTGAYRTAHGELQTSGPNEQGDEPLTLKIIL